MFVDTHAHIYTKDFGDDLDQMILRAHQVGISDIYMPNIDISTLDALLHVSERFPNCHPMIGLHPCHVFDDYKMELLKVEKLLPQRQYVGIGEIGIDLYWDKTYFEQQKKAFTNQIQLAKDANLPFVIHSRDALDLTIQIVEELQDGSLRGIFHCFGGDLVQAQRIIDVGFYLGIGGVLTYKKSGLDEVVTKIPLESMVLETDAPYLSPVPYRGKRNEPAYIVEIATKLGEIMGIELNIIAMQTTTNAKKIFK